MKKILLLLSFVLFFSIASANTGCNLKLSIVGSDITKINVPVKYEIKNSPNQAQITWNVLKSWNIVLVKNWGNFIYSFKTPWSVTLQALVAYSWCNYKLSKSIKIYKKIILLYQINNTFLSTINSAKKFVLIKNINNFSNNSLLKISDWILLPVSKFIDLFNNVPSDILNWKNLVIFSSNFIDFYKKVLLSYTKKFSNTKIYLFKKDKLLDVISNIYENKPLDKNALLNLSLKTSKFLPLSYAVNKLIQSNLLVKVIWIVLISIVWLLLISIFRQIIGLSVFWVYTPLIFAVIIILFGFKITFILFILSLIANIITSLLTNKIYVLYSSKIALNYTIYAIITILFFSLAVDYFPLDLWKINLSIVLLFLLLPLLTKNFIKEDTKIFSKTFFFFLVEFLFVTTILLLLFKWTMLQYILVAYPDLLWIILGLNILVGRFTWLQLLEYIRFAPLIKKSLYEEE